MRLSSMRYKGFVWPHNPRVYSIEFERSMAVNKIPFGRYSLQSLGLTRRIMRGEGAFVGEDAYRTFKELATVFYEDTAGVLVHPLWDTTTAWFVALELAQEPLPDYVKYTFEFWEDYNGPATTARLMETADGTAETESETTAGGGDDAVWHTVVKGESLWAIALHYGVALTDLIALNPQISNPNLIYVGQKVRVA